MKTISRDKKQQALTLFEKVFRGVEEKVSMMLALKTNTRRFIGGVLR